jgi:hypothetical protein
VDDRRHLAHRIDGEVVGPALLALLQVQDVQLVVGAELLEQDQRARRARLRRMEQRDVAAGDWHVWLLDGIGQAKRANAASRRAVIAALAAASTKLASKLFFASA